MHMHMHHVNLSVWYRWMVMSCGVHTGDGRVTDGGKCSSHVSDHNASRVRRCGYVWRCTGGAVQAHIWCCLLVRLSEFVPRDDERTYKQTQTTQQSYEHQPYSHQTPQGNINTAVIQSGGASRSRWSGVVSAYPPLCRCCLLSCCVGLNPSHYCHLVCLRPMSSSTDVWCGECVRVYVHM